MVRALFTRRELVKTSAHTAGSALLDRKSFPFRWRKLSYLVGADDPFVAAQLAVRVQFLESDVHELLNPELAALVVSEAADCIREWAEQINSKDLMERIGFLDFPAHLEARLLRDGDAMSMAHSLEVRPVMLDHAVVEYVLSLPSSIRLQKKRLLLDATRAYMPDALYSDLIARPKSTFTFPFSRWIRGDLRATIQETLSPDRLAVAGVLNPARSESFGIGTSRIPRRSAGRARGPSLFWHAGAKSCRPRCSDGRPLSKGPVWP